jgi:uncharacterized protein with von Willebrand factor type A (vWA) domain
MDMKPVKIGGELFWANWMNNFNTKFNEDNKKYECTIGNISDKAAEALKELGIQIKNKPEMGNYIVGKSLYKFEPKDQDGNSVDIEKIGNGTKVTALVSSYRHKMSAKFGAAPSIKMLIVTELKEYNAPAKEGQEEDDDIL